LEAATIRAKHPTLFSMAPTCEQMLAYESGGQQRWSDRGFLPSDPILLL